jgi:hypothetical protein
MWLFADNFFENTRLTELLPSNGMSQFGASEFFQNEQLKSPWRNPGYWDGR